MMLSELEISKNKFEKAIKKVEIIIKIPEISGITIPIIDPNHEKETVINTNDIRNRIRFIIKKIEKSAWFIK